MLVLLVLVLVVVVLVVVVVVVVVYTRVWVERKGPGKVLDFKKQRMVASYHLIQFELDSTTGHPFTDPKLNKPVQMILDRKANNGHRWLVECDQPNKITVSVQSATTVRAATKSVVQVAVVECLSAPSDCALAAMSA